MMGAFHAYDVRGVYGVDFTLADVYGIGYHLVGYLGAQQVVVGRDARVSSPAMHRALVRGITDAGADVLDLGLATTPMVYYATAQGGYEAAVQITASHNGKEYNGLKISQAGALPVGLDSGLGEIARRLESDPIILAAARGQVRPLRVREEYLAYLCSFKEGIDELRVAVDCSNGMAALLVHDLLPDTYHYLYDTLDGTFPNHEANPLIAENTAALRAAVVAQGCDAGIIFDGDADRVVFVDETGAFIPPDIMLGVMGLHFLGGTKGSKLEHVLVDIRTSKSVEAFLVPLGAQVHTWRVGRAYMAKRLSELGGLFGGELAGHYYFRDFFYSDSGLLAAIILLNVVAQLKQEGRTLSELVRSIVAYANSGEVNLRIDDKQGAMEALRAHFTQGEEPEAFSDIDGYRVEFADWWFNVRPSNTEPLLRLLVEARSAELMEARLAEARLVLAPYESET